MEKEQIYLTRNCWSYYAEITSKRNVELSYGRGGGKRVVEEGGRGEERETDRQTVRQTWSSVF